MSHFLPSTTLAVPTIKTERLILECPRLDDAEGYASIVTTERGRFVDGPLSAEEAWLDFAQMVVGWIFNGRGALSIRHEAGGKFLGVVLVHQEFGDPEPELGWLLTEDAEGHGYAFEAATAMRNWAFQEHGLETLVSYVDPENLRAIKLAKKLGGRQVEGPEGAITFRYDRPA